MMNLDPYSPPSVKEIIADIGEHLYQAMISTHKLRQVSSEVVFSEETYNKMVDKTIKVFNANGELSLAEWRDQFQTSRKYAQAFLEYLDQLGITVRIGEKRNLRNQRIN